jgi:hypothetical protein
MHTAFLEDHPCCRFKKEIVHTVIRGMTAPAAIEAITAITIMINSFLLAYRKSAKYPTVNFGASICLSIISLSCSLSPAIGGFTSSNGAPCFSLIATSDDEAGDRVVIVEKCIAQVQSIPCRNGPRAQSSQKTRLTWRKDVKEQGEITKQQSRNSLEDALPRRHQPGT